MKNFKGSSDAYVVVAEDQDIAIGMRMNISGMQHIVIRFAGVAQQEETPPKHVPQHFGTRSKSGFLGDDMKKHYGWHLDKITVPVFGVCASVADWEKEDASNEIRKSMADWSVDQLKLAGYKPTKEMKATVASVIDLAFPVMEYVFAKPKNIFNEPKVTDVPVDNDDDEGETSNDD